MTGRAPEYGRLSSLVYQVDKPIGTSFGDVELYRDLLAGVTGEILEPAVGTGRVLIPLCEAGLRVRGFDTSAPMLAVCRENCAVRGLAPELFEADMTTFNDPSAFDAVIIPAGSFALVTGRDRALRTLRNFHTCLRPGGRLILDAEPLEPLGPAITVDPLRHWWHGDDLLTLTSLPAALAEKDVRSTWLRYELWRDGRLVDAELQKFDLQIYQLDELAGLLREAGFTVTAVHADYEAGRPASADARQWTIEATAR
ncbi:MULTISPECIES: class I SAM-dependent methyltransferase [Frankia]|uniref:Methyltransferase n=1 Tax=Frankia alni (strain DSM 45986 / CECT 9034 / ACN14a) TaxID=326424 RepID=Q0RHE4_FRAAA|nr:MULTISPECIES: class I SAM-dependent methyltransferase [Frankia]CAJ63085.1 Putative methyltransferase [Frankia alni ACN14a]